jgi:hypothetical protein
MNGLSRSVSAIVLLLLTPAARADDPKGIAREFVVEGGSGGFDIVVSPEFVTTLYFPEPVVSAIAADQKSFEIVKMTRSVVVQPSRSAKKDSKTNLNVATEHMQVSILLRIGETDQAVSQVTFVRAEEKTHFEERVKAEVERQVAERLAQVDEERRRMPQEIDARVRTQMADRILSRFETQSLRAIDRTDDNVVVRVTQAVLAGPDAYVRFEIQNREGLRYVLRDVEVVVGKTRIPGLVRVEKSAAPGVAHAIAVVEGKETRAAGIVVLPAGQVSGQTVSLRFVAEGQEALTLSGIRLK